MTLRSPVERSQLAGITIMRSGGSHSDQLRTRGTYLCGQAWAHGMPFLITANGTIQVSFLVCSSSCRAQGEAGFVDAQEQCVAGNSFVTSLRLGSRWKRRRMEGSRLLGCYRSGYQCG